ncbi:Uric acid degradation bifunctional protein TTL [Morella rubra]|uniref:Uric acid degradation bifunctional protein TTL n=1 Tax=Morella rubra TaxID=262757 RepID=A0A6A1WIF3_9ROSI|nr:Uric acid degradation bifunctional protein TTL [Morella rubra]
MELSFEEKDFLACCGSTKFAKQMALASPFASLEEAVGTARDKWFNNVDVSAWLQAFSAHPQIGDSTPSSQHHHPSVISAQWSKGEQSTALATATGSMLQELSEWNARYREKFGFVFLICASGRTSDEIFAELKCQNLHSFPRCLRAAFSGSDMLCSSSESHRYPNRPIVELEIAAKEQMKITELRLAKLFSSKAKEFSMAGQYPALVAKKVEEDRTSIIGGHLTAASEATAGKRFQIPTRTRPPITTHVLDVSRGCPAAGIEVRLEMWKGPHPRPSFNEADIGGWMFQGSSTTDNDGRSGQLMGIVDVVDPGIYKISFNTGKYNPAGFFPYVSIVFEIRESQRMDHFHVPLLLSPFSFSTYRGS